MRSSARGAGSSRETFHNSRISNLNISGESRKLYSLIMAGVASTLAKKRALAAGFGTNANALKYLNQDFHSLRAQSQSRGALFCDPTFAAAPESLGFKELGRNSPKTRGVIWKRPTVCYLLTNEADIR